MSLGRVAAAVSHAIGGSYALSALGTFPSRWAQNDELIRVNRRALDALIGIEAREEESP